MAGCRQRRIYNGNVSGRPFREKRDSEKNDNYLFELEENGGVLDKFNEEIIQNGMVPYDGTKLEFCIDQNCLGNNPLVSSGAYIYTIS